MLKYPARTHTLAANLVCLLSLSLGVACGSSAGDSSASGGSASGGSANGGSGSGGGSGASVGSAGSGASVGSGGSAGSANGGSANGGSGSGGGYQGSGGANNGETGATSGGAAGAQAITENDWVETATQNTSTFGADVDTASYSQMRSSLAQGSWPPAPGVRVEEYVNYFRYDYPEATDTPFSVNFELAPSEFGAAGQELFRVGLKGKQVPLSERKPANLVFLVDVSGSMGAPNKLPLVQWSLQQLVKKLEPTDRLGIVVYAGRDAVLLEPTPVEDQGQVLDAIYSLTAGGGTNGAAGIQRAYRMAESAYRSNGINRVVLCTDGDFNVGLTGAPLVSEIEAYRAKGINLSVLGFGIGNNDSLMESLADHGDGNYAYIDTQNEALKVLGDNLVSTLQVIAKDVKIQVEFSADSVDRYRLIGYENRLLANEDFIDDTKDAGDMGAGHFVTSFYEIERHADATEGLMATVRLRYKKPTSAVSQELLFDFDLSAARASFSEASADFRFAAGVVEFAEILRGSKHSTGQRFEDVLSIVEATQGDDPLRAEFHGLVVRAQGISH